MELLALVESPGHVCCRYRVSAFEPYLRYFGVNVTYQAIARSAPARLAQMSAAGRYDAVLLQRKLLDSVSLAALRKAAKFLAFDFDDAVVYRDSYSPKGHHCPRRKARFSNIARCADQLLAGNAFLAQLAEEHGARSTKVRYMPTCVDADRYEAVRLDALKRPPDGPFVMVWVGSSSTLKGLEATSGLWNAIGEHVPAATLRVVCDRFPRFDRLAVEPVDWSEATEIDWIVASDAGVSHVPDDLWSRGKCGLKVLQYMAAGIPVLTNPVGVHREMIRSGRSGFLVKDTREWVEAVRWLAGNRDRAAAMGREAMDEIRRAYDVADWGPFFVDWVMPGAVSPGIPEPNAQRNTTEDASREWVVDPGTSRRHVRGPHQDNKIDTRPGQHA
jgi:glycosyltransferase involved in cell wall biosynthesis